MLIVHKSFSENVLVDFVCKKFFSPVCRLNYESAVGRGTKIARNVKKVTGINLEGKELGFVTKYYMS